MIPFLERNREIVNEIRNEQAKNPFLGRGVLIGASYGTEFYSAGSYSSGIFKGPLHLGFKYAYYPRSRVQGETAAMAIIAAGAPEYIPELPRAYTLVAGQQGEKAILMEDFTRERRDTLLKSLL